MTKRANADTTIRVCVCVNYNTDRQHMWRENLTRILCDAFRELQAGCREGRERKMRVHIVLGRVPLRIYAEHNLKDVT